MGFPFQWTADEQQVFETLAGGREFSDLRPEERGDYPFVLLAHHPVAAPAQPRVQITGRFLSDIARLCMDELPIGLQLRGVAVTGKVDFENINTEKAVFLENCHFDGPFVARNARFIALSLTGSVFRNYVDLRDCGIDGSLFMRWSFHSLATALLRDITVRGVIDCDQSVFEFDKFGNLRSTDEDMFVAAAGESFSLSRSTASALFWRKMQVRPGGTVNLRNCKIGSFRDAISPTEENDDESTRGNDDPDRNIARDWPEPDNLRISGLKYDERSSTDPQALISWIKLQDRRENAYGSYQTAIKVMLDNGHEPSADRLIVEKQRFMAENDGTAINKFLRWFYLVTTEAGTNTQRIVGITVVLFLVSWAIIALEQEIGGFEPKSSDVLKDECRLPATADAKCAIWKPYRTYRIPNYYPQFSSLGFTIDQFVPGVNYGTSADWRAATGESSLIVVMVRICGIISSTLILLCLSGIARLSR